MTPVEKATADLLEEIDRLRSELLERDEMIRELQMMVERAHS